MIRAATPAPPVRVDVPVVLTAIVRLEPDAGSYSASILALPDCHTQDETLDEVRANLREAAEEWLAVDHEDGIACDAPHLSPCRHWAANRSARPCKPNLKPGTQHG